MKTRNLSTYFLILTTIGGALAALASGCDRQETFPELGNKIASPVAVALAGDESHFYILSSDFDRTYNKGSILVVTTAGDKVTALPIPRMGRTLTAAGNDLLMTYDADGDTQTAGAILYDISSPANPAEVKRFELPCNPLNVVMRKNYNHFAISCEYEGNLGGLAIGTLAADRSASTIKLVRAYGTARRAMHLDPQGELLYAFPTDFGAQTWADLSLDDAVSYDADGNMSDGPNEIPDEYEKSRRVRANLTQRRIYQFILYDLAAQRSATPEPFPFKDSSSSEITAEYRWIYFNANAFAGVADSDAGLTSTSATRRYYRTNFFSAAPDPEDDASFYLSHRGRINPQNGLGSPQANDVLRVSITGNPRTGSDGTPPKTEDILQFTRVYGRGNEDNEKGLHYPGDISVQRINGTKTVLVNHFRDLINWSRSQVYFGIAAKPLGDNYWSPEMGSTDPMDSFYQFAVTSSGRGATCSYYGNQVILFDVMPGAAITERLRIQ